MRALFLLAAFLLGSTHALDILAGLEAPRSTPTERVRVLADESELLSFVQSSPVVVLFVGGSFGGLEEQLALEGLKVPIGKIQTVGDIADGSIVVYRNGKKLPLHCRRDVATLVSFIREVRQPATTIVESHLVKETLKKQAGVKLLGYFVDGSPEHLAFNEAAELFHPMVRFYTIFNAEIATRLKFNATGEIVMYRDLDKKPIPCASNPASLADIQRFIVTNKQTSGIFRVTPANLHAPHPEASLILLTDSTSLSYIAFKRIVHIFRNLTTELNKPRMLWIDSTDFPSVDFAELFPGVKIPSIGALPAALQGAIEWVVIRETVAAQQGADSLNVDEIRALIERQSALKGQERLATVAEGAAFSLACHKTLDMVGTCQWIKDGTHVTPGSSQLPHVVWAQPATDDCTLLITRVSTADAGAWQCLNAQDGTQLSEPLRLTVSRTNSEL